MRLQYSHGEGGELIVTEIRTLPEFLSDGIRDIIDRHGTSAFGVGGEVVSFLEEHLAPHGLDKHEVVGPAEYA